MLPDLSSKGGERFLIKFVKKLLHFVGPWPIQASYLAALTFFMVASLYSLGAKKNIYFSWDAIERPIFSGLIAAFAYCQLRLMTFLIKKYRESLSIYLSILLVQSFLVWAWIVLFRNIFPSINSSYTAFLSPIPVIRFLFTYLCINAFIGVSRAKLEKALKEKEATLQLVESQRNLLLEYDEMTRKKLSEFLHDRVQSSLVASCLELQEVARNVDHSSKVRISEIIDSLERLRSVDVRSASQTLSPAVGNADLHTSVTTMTTEYAPYINVNFSDLSEVERLQLESNPNLFLGIYRIIEQSFLNCAIHGKAKNFEISITSTLNEIILKTSNDGALLSKMTKEGLGTAIINSWVRTLKGSWMLQNSTNGCVELVVVLPRTS